METLVIYDIPNDGLRGKIANACKDYGLERIQFSAFRGELGHNRREELAKRLRRTLGRSAGNVQVYPVCEKDLSLTVSIGEDRRPFA